MKRVVLFALMAISCCVPVFAVDTDGDGFDDAVDCAPSLSSTWAVPGEASELRATGAGRLTWLGAEQAHVYDLYRGAIPAGTPFAYSHECLQPQLLSLETADSEDPPPGVLFYYLVGGRNGCGYGVLGYGTAGLLPNDSPCPPDPVADADGDGVPDVDDVCAGAFDPNQEDGDLDGVGTACDVCPAMPDPDQSDADGDAAGDACDACPDDAADDADGDGVCGDVDNCPDVFNSGQEDGDGNGVGDACQAPGLVVINEVQYDQSNGTQEFIELYAVQGPANITGWQLSDGEAPPSGVSFTFASSDARFPCSEPFVLETGDQVVVFQGTGTPQCTGSYRRIYLAGGTFLQRMGDDVTLRDASLACRDYVAFESGGNPTDCAWNGNPNPTNGNVLDRSLSRFDGAPFDDNDLGSDWEASGATTTAGPSSAGSPNEVGLVDSDGDGVADESDNCPATANANQADADGDGLGNVCDICPNPTSCDNGLFCDGVETCDPLLGCRAGTPPAADDGVACTADSCDEATDGIVHTANHASCDDGLFCDGVESCDVLLGCQAGTPPSTDDGVACTDDSCDEDTNEIVHSPNHASCDNGLYCDGAESCDVLLGCQAGPSIVDDGVACTDDSCDEATDTVVHIPNHASCDDGLFCDGVESCDVLLGCQAGTPPATDDGVACTDDSCDEATDTVVHIPNHASCDDGLFCDGAESCDVLLDCQAGTPPATDDGVSCTDDSCDEATDTVVHNPNHASCDNGLFCDGAESCDVLLGCQAGTPPSTDDGVACTDDSCDEATDTAVHSPNHASCDNGLFCDGAESCDVLLGCQAGTPPVTDDGVACTDDSCDEATDTVVHIPNHASCDDGLFCDGAESCDVLLGCQAGTPPATDDGVSCTDDSCDEATDTVVHIPNHASCDDGLFCDGAESCDVLLGCQAGTPPATDDGVSCTDDSCDEATDTAVHSPNHASCDNGLFCDGAESCDVLLGCQAGTPPVTDDGVACTDDSCDEATDTVVHIPNHGSCDNTLFCDGVESCDVLLDCQAGTPPATDDGVSCTDDSCDEATDTVVHIPNHGSCDNTLFCDGVESCDVLLDCQAGTPPSTDDGVACTGDSCDEEADTVVHSPNHASCDNTLFCDGVESCDVLLGCQAGTPPATDDGVACTDDSCDEEADTVAHSPNHASCDDGLFCDGAESCDALLGCQAGTPPSTDDDVACTDDSCDEDTDAVVHIPNHGSCDNGLFCDGAEVCDAVLGCQAGPSVVDDLIACTDDSCDEETDAVSHIPNHASCDNGLFCDGVESCDVLLGCQAGTPPSTDDGVACTDDSCDEETDAVSHNPNHASCDSGLFCDGAESCDVLLGCQVGTPPATDDGVACTDDSCDEDTDTVVHSPNHASCDNMLFCDGVESCDVLLGCQAGTPPVTDDGVACTDDSCDEDTNEIVHSPNHASCDNTLFCDGVEVCDPVLGCQAGPSIVDDGVACTDDSCDEATDTVVHSPNHASCDNTLFCDGAESCDVLLDCQAGTPPSADDGVACTDDSCDEETDAVVHIPNHGSCDDGLFCDGVESCDVLLGCQAGTPPVTDDGVACTDDSCDEDTNEIVHSPNHASCDNTLFCDGVEVCDPVLGCQAGPSIVDDGVACTADSCDEGTDTVSHSPNHASCDNALFCDGVESCDALLDCQAGTPPSIDDGVACTDDSCDEATDSFVHTPNHASCDNTLFCDGVESCDALLGCQAGTPPPIDDGVPCTDDSCDEGTDTVSHSPNHASCDNTLFCDGVESCDALLGCQAGTPPATDDGVTCTGDSCDEDTNEIVHSPNHASCDNTLFCDGAEVCDALLGCQAGPSVVDDGIACTDDSCDEETDAVSHIPNHASCDDGLFCDGAESCDVLLGCQAGTPPVTDDGVSCTDDSCDEATDTVVHSPNHASCDNVLFCDGAEVCDPVLGCQAGTPPSTDDGIACTDDSCDEETDAVSHSPNHASCDNTLFCDGAESCDVLLGCQAGTPPATDDGVTCTDDSCDEATDTVVHSPNHASCDNTLFCDGVESCDVLLGCQAGTPPSTDDGVTCTGDSCDEATDTVVHSPNHASCDNTLFCDGVESCDVLLGCQAGTPPATDDGVACTDDSCDEEADTVVHSPNHASCDNTLFCDGAESCDVLLGCQAGTPPATDDGVACTDDSCDEATDTVVHSPNHASCDNVLFCDGAEVCDPVLGCQAGTPPSTDDGIACTDDSCDEEADTVVHSPNHASCDNTLFCDGAESCDVLLGCQAGTPPSTDDGVTCTGDSCDEATDTVVHSPNHASCDNTLFCDGVESCDVLLGCQAGTPPPTDDGVACTDDSCDEATDTVVHSPNHASCDNTLFCDGAESCDVLLGCQAGTPPATDDGVSCTDDSCDEGTDTVSHSPNHASCDNALFCDGVESCDALLDCQAGTPPSIDDGVACTDDSCDEATDSFVHTPNHASCDNTLFCDGVESCDALLGCQAGTPPPIDDGVPCTDDSCDEVTDTVVHSSNDEDLDEVCDDDDNCPSVSNVDQSNADGDANGDACDPCPNDSADDVDEDGVCGDVDNCLDVFNPGQEDGDGNGVGDACQIPGLVVINEVQYDQSNGTQEFIELYAVQGPANITGWQLSDGEAPPSGVSFTFASSDARFPCSEPFVLETGDHVVVFHGTGTPQCTGSYRRIYLTGGTFLQRTGDDVTLRDASLACRDYVAFENGGNPTDCAWTGTPNPTNGDVLDRSLSRFDGAPFDDNDLGSDWEASGATTTAGPSSAGSPNEVGLVDSDGDGVTDGIDNCPSAANANQADVDGDGLGNVCDNCPSVSNASQVDVDSDGLGNACDPCPNDAQNDADSDGFCADADNCPTVSNLDQADEDTDDVGDVCDPCLGDPSNDFDGDGVCGAVDNCPTVHNPGQADFDENGVGDVCEGPQTVDILIVDQDIRSNAEDNAQHRQQPSRRLGLRTGVLYRTLTWFDISSIPEHANILSATLVYHTTSGDPENINTNGDTPPSGGTILVEVHEVLRPWNYDEPFTYLPDLSDNEKDVEADETTWRYTLYPEEWEQVGATGLSDSGPAIASQTVSSALDTQVTISSSALADAVQSWVAGSAPNHGFLVKASDLYEQSVADNRKIFCGKGFPLETSTGLTQAEAEAHRPFVRIEYELP